ncbi:carbamoyltransferase HypF [Parabacteroides acidifaciens]|uniref:Carbamoyltransferase n=1 Tax=Parabacteroides acidifaciens TaxID=2290935 RepID=A0A3D8HJY6_9BACT|nr:carbamoyltransferase HypF [Parabacteroides acidifaciens]MBC8600128.1 carbamoyltransferase HypF [Parabacteroides acidifaciens]RDU51082.1 carbamoyltransferase HypF [Parabacteroides acidifaciens]
MKKTGVVISVLTIQGLVQGVGFRPFIYRIASEMGISGEVDNRNNGVCIRAALTALQREQLIGRIRREHPVVASIHRISVSEIVMKENPYTDFRITPSRSDSDEVTQVAPDIAVCPECLRDRKAQPHRLQYPFINCTLCGPRFSIICDLPYDRRQTTMSAFPMCSECRKEYTTVSDRRFHAEPVACNHCGPSYYTLYNRETLTDYPELLALSSRLLGEGEVIAAKGIGGYHLVCDATNEQAVARLREIKQRDGKPFAVMFRNPEQVRQFAWLNEVEEECLLSWRRPIVLLKQRRPLAASVNPGMQTLGCMLPYMPIHEDWFERLDTPVLVMTSGNLSDCPIAITPGEAERQLAGKVPLLLHHNRDIHNRVDDSVLQVCGGQPCLMRRSRGYVPEPFFADMPVEGILAFGAEKVNTFALGKGETILQSQYIGDLKNWETYQFYTESLERFRHLFRFRPSRLVCDLHPDYLSSREAERLSSDLHLPLLHVQHHHAHAAACMLEYGLDEPVIALVLDGTGLGDDGKAWGGEIFLCDRRSYKRLSHLEYVPLPGGDKASTEPWRMAVACLWHYFGEELPFPSGFVQRIGEAKIQMLLKMMEKGINTPYTSSAGRLFDAVASLLGVCDVSTHQAEAPVKLEQLASDEHQSRYSVLIEEEVISMRPVLKGILEDLNAGVSAGDLSARFHNTLSWLLLEKAKLYRLQTGVEKVVISGGCFQNKRLTEQLQRMFAKENIPLYVPGRIPCNDGGIAVGQLAIAASLYEGK